MVTHYIISWYKYLFYPETELKTISTKKNTVESIATTKSTYISNKTHFVSPGMIQSAKNKLKKRKYDSGTYPPLKKHHHPILDELLRTTPHQ